MTYRHTANCVMVPTTRDAFHTTDWAEHRVTRDVRSGPRRDRPRSCCAIEQRGTTTPQTVGCWRRHLIETFGGIWEPYKWVRAPAFGSTRAPTTFSNQHAQVVSGRAGRGDRCPFRAPRCSWPLPRKPDPTSRPSAFTSASRASSGRRRPLSRRWPRPSHEQPGTGGPPAAAAIATQGAGILQRDREKHGHNCDQTVSAPLNDYTATVIGMVRDDVAFNTALSADILYTVNSGRRPPLVSAANNDHYATAEANGVDLSTALKATTQSGTVHGIPDAEAHRGPHHHPRGGVGLLHQRPTARCSASP